MNLDKHALMQLSNDGLHIKDLTKITAPTVQDVYSDSVESATASRRWNVVVQLNNHLGEVEKRVRLRRWENE